MAMLKNTQGIKSENIREKEKAGRFPCLLLNFLSHSENTASHVKTMGYRVFDPFPSPEHHPASYACLLSEYERLRRSLAGAPFRGGLGRS